MSLGQRLKQARQYAKFSQIALAEKSGVSQQTISNIESGIQDKSTDVVQLAVACGVRPEWLGLGTGEMVDGLYVEDEKIKKAVLLMQEMPDYAVDEALKSIDSMSKLSQIATQQIAAKRKPSM
jgi:transcriptional regulator with XRE-family HTH domain